MVASQKGTAVTTKTSQIMVAIPVVGMCNVHRTVAVVGCHGGSSCDNHSSFGDADGSAAAAAAAAARSDAGW